MKLGKFQESFSESLKKKKVLLLEAYSVDIELIIAPETLRAQLIKRNYSLAQYYIVWPHILPFFNSRRRVDYNV